MSVPIIPQDAAEDKPIQIGPPWHCWICDAPAPRLRSYSSFLPEGVTVPNPIAAWGEHIWYMLGLPCGHEITSVRLGDAITPLGQIYSSEVQTSAELKADEQRAIERVRAALAHIAAHHGPNPQADPASSIVYQIIAGTLLPEDAIQAIRTLVHQAVTGALIVPEPELAFQQEEV
jgi:hypothetical protein